MSKKHTKPHPLSLTHIHTHTKQQPNFSTYTSNCEKGIKEFTVTKIKFILRVVNIFGFSVRHSLRSMFVFFHTACVHMKP